MNPTKQTETGQGAKWADTPKYDALLKKLEGLPRIEGDKLLREFAQNMEQEFMDSRFDDITKAGSIAIWNAVQEIGPWNESNDMPWEDEILCGLHIAKSSHAALTEQNRKMAELLREIGDEVLAFPDSPPSHSSDSYLPAHIVNKIRRIATP